ncbi:uncharacterized protein LOC117317101 [Pecten maximus]|uniref:uncharacterized protein LOC117317101 n=1 Tax=Pecten maximus TaxID=6579 RepID=UPI001458A961|nr:uncharacterized protein LOC117317101 [Pecten maximus]
MAPLDFRCTLFVHFIVMLCGGVYTDNKVCYECWHMSHPRDCNIVVECGPHQTCFVNRYVTSDAHVYYNSGCLSSQSCHNHHHTYLMGRRTPEKMTSITEIDDKDLKRNNPSQHPDCSLCCHQSFCNTNLCETHQVNSTRKRCLSCDSVEQLSDCHTVRGCDVDEMCFSSYYLNTFGEKRYRLGCMRQNVCHHGGDSHIGETQYCSKCCHGEHCNRDLCEHAPSTTSSIAPTSPTTTTTPTTTAPPVCEDDPNRPCIASILSSICNDQTFSQFCRKSCGLCGSLTSLPPAITMVTTIPTSTPVVTSSISSSPDCQDSNHQSCDHEILPIVCSDDVLKFYCMKSCNICGMTVPTPAVCVDTHPVQCNNQTLLQGICPDEELAELFCRKSCGKCHDSTTVSTCRDDDTSCFNIQFLTTACLDPAKRNLCKKSCNLCT